MHYFPLSQRQNHVPQRVKHRGEEPMAAVEVEGLKEKSTSL